MVAQRNRESVQLVLGRGRSKSKEIPVWRRYLTSPKKRKGCGKAFLEEVNSRDKRYYDAFKQTVGCAMDLFYPKGNGEGVLGGCSFVLKFTFIVFFF